jgi:hypothetical protein
MAVFNPHGKLISMLPVIYGFNNGGSRGDFEGALMADDGTYLGGHICSSEGFMIGDLGIREGSRPDRHESFRAHYPDGYRMAFVTGKEVVAKSHEVARWLGSRAGEEPPAVVGFLLTTCPLVVG